MVGNATAGSISVVIHNLENAALAHRVFHIRDGVPAGDIRQRTDASHVRNNVAVLESPTYN